MSDLAPPRAVLDADVIFSRVLHELFGRIAAEAQLLSLIWSDELLAEATRSLQRGKGLGGRVRLSDAPAGVDLAGLTDDPADEHVCALAVAGGASLLFTFVQGYDQERLGSLGVDVMRPDAWLSSAAAQEPAVFADVLGRQAAVWGGGRPQEELLSALERAGAPEFVATIKPHLD